MELKQKIIGVLSSWTSMSELVSQTGGDKEKVREEIKDLLDQDLITTIGKGRGTKYGLPGTAVESARDLKSEVLAALGSGSKSRKDLCDELSTDELTVYDIQVKVGLETLIKEGLVSKNDKKRGQKFWLSDGDAPENEEGESFESQVLEELSLGGKTIKDLNEKLKSYAAKTKNCLDELLERNLIQTNGAKRGTVYWLMGEDNVQDASGNTSGPEIDNFDDLLRAGISHIPHGTGHDQSEILKIICEASKNSLCQWELGQKLSKAITAGKHGLMWRQEMDMQQGGNRVKVYLGSMPAR